MRESKFSGGQGAAKDTAGLIEDHESNGGESEVDHVAIAVHTSVKREVKAPVDQVSAGSAQQAQRTDGITTASRGWKR